MIKTSVTVALLAIGCLSYAYAQNAPVSEAISQDRQKINETRTMVQRHEEALAALRKQVAANPAAPPTLAANGSARYDRVLGDCQGFWFPSADKQKEINKFNAMPDDGYNRFLSDCRAKRTAAEFAAEARHAQERQQRVAAMTPPPAPGAIQDEESEQPTTAEYNGDRDGPAAVQQAGYYMGRPGYGRPAHGGRSCPRGFHYDPSAGACAHHVDLVGPTKYDVPDDIARCVPGTTQTRMVPGPFGPRKIFQVCRVHH